MVGFTQIADVGVFEVSRRSQFRKEWLLLVILSDGELESRYSVVLIDEGLENNKTNEESST